MPHTTDRRVTSTTPLLPSSQSRSTSPRAPRDPSQTRFLPLKHLAFRRRRTPPVQVVPAIITSILLIALIFTAWDISSYGQCYFRPLCRMLGTGMTAREEVWWMNAGPYAPRRSLGEGGGKKGLPRGCEVDQVTVLHRHAARYPTKDAGKRTLKALKKLAKRSVPAPRHHGELTFLNRADFKLKGYKFDELTNQGRKEAWRSGKRYAALYKHLLDEGEGLFTRSAGGGRVVETGSYWLQGFNGDSFKVASKSTLPQVDVIIPEGGLDTNNTLSVHKCPAYEDSDPPPGTNETEAIRSLLQPTVDRLNHLLQPHPRLDISDIPPLADMCGYDSQAEGSDWSGWSEWCTMFTVKEWDLIGYAREVARYYQVGQGSPYGPAMGAGYVQELLARLNDSSPIQSPTINGTLDSNPATFPQGGKRLFVDFSHDNEMIEILAAMHVVRQHANLPTDYVPTKRAFVLSELIPFGGEIVFERIACDLGNWEPDPNAGNDSGDEDRRRDGRKDYVRILINDKIHRVDHVDCKQSGLGEHGMCEVELFASAQAAFAGDTDWSVCLRDRS